MKQCFFAVDLEGLPVVAQFGNFTSNGLEMEEETAFQII